MGNNNTTPPLTMPGVVQLEIQGIPASFVDVPRGDRPVEIMLAKTGELAPYLRGLLAPGVALLVIPPEVADMVRAGYAREIAKAKADAAGGPH